jgi:hypothetical protein
MNTYTNRLPVLHSAFALLLFACFVADAGTTALVNYQGKLKKHGTNENAQVAVNFKVFTGETNSECVFEETKQVTVVDGLYSVLIGENPLLGTIEDACALDSAYLEVSINGNTLKPREKFTPPPFAARTAQVWNVFGHGGYSHGPEYISVHSSLSEIGYATPWDLLQAGDTGWLTFPSPPRNVTIRSVKCCLGENTWVSPTGGQPVAPTIYLEPIVEGVSGVRSIGNVTIMPLLTTNYNGSNAMITNAPVCVTLSLNTNATAKILRPGDYLRIRATVTTLLGPFISVVNPRLTCEVDVR